MFFLMFSKIAGLEFKANRHIHRSWAIKIKYISRWLCDLELFACNLIRWFCWFWRHKKISFIFHAISAKCLTVDSQFFGANFSDTLLATIALKNVSRIGPEEEEEKQNMMMNWRTHKERTSLFFAFRFQWQSSA